MAKKTHHYKYKKNLKFSNFPRWCYDGGSVVSGVSLKVPSSSEKDTTKNSLLIQIDDNFQNKAKQTHYV